MHDFDLLVFESDFYGVKKSWDDILEGAKPGEALAQSIFFIWSATKSFQEFSKYIGDQLVSGDTLQVLGFDNQLASKIFREEFDEVKDYITNSQVISETQRSSLLETISLLKVRKH